MNWVVKTYLNAQVNANEEGRAVKTGTRKALVSQGITKFSIEGKSNVSKQTITSRIKAKRLEVWHPASTSPIVLVEITLISFILNAWNVKCPLSVSRCIELAESLIVGTLHETKLIAWKVKHRVYHPDQTLLGWK